MKKFSVIDCETDPFAESRIPQPFLWGYYNHDDGYKQFVKLKDLMEFLDGQELRIYAHNGGKFDFHYIIPYIENWTKLSLINGRIAKFKIGSLEFNDSYCILPVPLSAYQKTKIDYKIFEKEEREKPENWAKISAYLKDDCIFLYELIEHFLRDNGYALTIASSAIKKLQKIEKIKIKNSGKDFYDAIKPYYFGGRVECFKKGIINRKVEIYDINSAYPYAMTFEHPWGEYFIRHDKNPKIETHNFYKFSCKSQGYFPYRNQDKTLFFPNDNIDRTFYVTGWELDAALELGLENITHIEQVIFKQTKNYKKYVNHFYEIKKNSKKGSPENIFSKLYLNSAYGKFAANPEKYDETYITHISDFAKAITEGFQICGEIHDKILISKPSEDDARYYNIAIGASITGFVRAYLMKALNNVYRPIYCDTDSIICEKNNKLKLGEELGQWKYEGTFNNGGIGGKKIYAFKNDKETKTACKGLILNYDEIMAVCHGDIIEKTPINPIYSIKKGIYFQKKTICMT